MGDRADWGTEEDWKLTIDDRVSELKKEGLTGQQIYDTVSRDLEDIDELDRRPRLLERLKEYLKARCFPPVRIPAAEGAGKTHRESFLTKHNLADKSYSLPQLAKISKVPVAILKEVYSRGLGAAKTQPDSVRLKGSFVKNVKAPRSAKLPARQWAMARVYSFLDGNPSHDNDLRANKEKVGGLVFDKETAFYNAFKMVADSIYEYGATKKLWYVKQKTINKAAETLPEAYRAEWLGLLANYLRDNDINIMAGGMKGGQGENEYNTYLSGVEKYNARIQRMNLNLQPKVPMSFEEWSATQGQRQAGVAEHRANVVAELPALEAAQEAYAADPDVMCAYNEKGEKVKTRMKKSQCAAAYRAADPVTTGLLKVGDVVSNLLSNVPGVGQAFSTVYDTVKGPALEGSPYGAEYTGGNIVSRGRMSRLRGSAIIVVSQDSLKGKGKLVGGNRMLREIANVLVAIAAGVATGVPLYTTSALSTNPIDSAISSAALGIMAGILSYGVGRPFIDGPINAELNRMIREGNLTRAQAEAALDAGQSIEEQVRAILPRTDAPDIRNIPVPAGARDVNQDPITDGEIVYFLDVGPGDVVRPANVVTASDMRSIAQAELERAEVEHRVATIRNPWTNLPVMRIAAGRARTVPEGEEARIPEMGFPLEDEATAGAPREEVAVDVAEEIPEDRRAPPTLTVSPAVQMVLPDEGVQMVENPMRRGRGKKLKYGLGDKELLGKILMEHPMANKLVGEGFFQDLYNNFRNIVSSVVTRVTDVTKGVRQGYSPKVRQLLAQVGYDPVVEINIRRDPIQSILHKVLNVVTLGKWNELRGKYAYDKVFHLGVEVVVKVDEANEAYRRFVIEKNEVINISPAKAYTSNTEIYKVPMDAGTTIHKLMDNTQQRMGDKFFVYDAFTNNCQDFILNLLQANGLATPRLEAIVKQPLEKVIQGLPGYTGKVARAVTDVAAVANVALEGRGSPSVQFAKQLTKLGVKPERYLQMARAAAQRAGYNPKMVRYSPSDKSKLAIQTPDGKVVDFGRSGYMDFLLYSLTGTKEKADKQRRAYRARATKIKGDWKDDKYSPNNLAIHILW